ncbi:MAG: glycoside hydrolase family 2 TIM barrel-domain containing protein, partial [Candidatus Eiseniibacteriota bacterium]
MSFADLDHARISRGVRAATVAAVFLGVLGSPGTWRPWGTGGAGVARAQETTAPVRPEVRIIEDDSGLKLALDGRDTMVFGMNWDYIPIGENYAYNLWAQPDAFIEEVLEREMSLMRDMGVNSIRQYVGIPPRWVTYIYERYGITTIVNHLVARYGYTLDGVWIPSVDYSDERLRDALKAEVAAMVEAYEGTPGILMWLLGNENNYGLSWTSFEIEALPEGERDAARARYLYSLFGELIDVIKEHDGERPVAICNGDLQYIDLIAEECPSLDVLGTNVYRGISARDLYQVVHDKLGVPVLYTEFGADAFNARTMREDQIPQARYLIGQWQEIYEQSSGKGRVGNAIGGYIFQWSDGWWKYGQDSRLDIHDTHASWPNGGYVEDYVEGQNNMNEEWWGICAKGPADQSGLFEVYPRAAYYALKHAFRLHPYAPATDLDTIRAHFGAIRPGTAYVEARADRAALIAEKLDRVRLSGLRLEFETIHTAGSNTTTPPAETPGTGQPAFRGFDQLQSFYASFEAKPQENVRGTLTLNVLGNVPENPIDEIFYENRGRPRDIVGLDGSTPEIVEMNDIERVKVYDASISWDDSWFMLEGFYRTGHFHWGYEGDFFGLYREAYYGENIDIYNGIAPVGFTIDGKRDLAGLTLALGPELWWGANPGFLLKYSRQLGRFEATGIFHEDLAEQSRISSSIAVPLPKTRKATVHLATTRGSFGIEVGGIWSGATKVDDTFQIAVRSPEGYDLLQDRVRTADAFGAKAKLTYQKGRWNWYGQGAIMGVVADGGPTATTTFTGWTLKDSGSGNQSNFLTGLAVQLGNWQVAPNVLWQKPIVGPVPGDVPSPGRPRNILDDPFAVRDNRETLGAELMLTYDPTPETWMWAWDNDVREDSPLAASISLVYRDHRTTADAAIGILEDGRTTFAFPGATPPRDLWELKVRLVSRFSRDLRVVSHIFAGTAEPNGDDGRLIKRWGSDVRVAWRSMAVEMGAKFDDWGPYDYHKDFNLTFPIQVAGDVSYTLGSPRWFGEPQTRIGISGKWRSLDRFSPRYCPQQV